MKHSRKKYCFKIMYRFHKVCEENNLRAKRGKENIIRTKNGNRRLKKK